MTTNRLPVEKLTPDLLEAVEAASRLFDVYRANQIRHLLLWENGGCLARGCQRPAFEEITAQERAALRQLWAAMPASACLMDAVSILCGAYAYGTETSDHHFQIVP